MSKISSIQELISVFGIWSVPERVKKFFTTCFDSCRNSKFNFFFQVINLCLIILLFWFILPSKFEFLVNLENLTGGILGNFVLWVVSIILFPVSKIFETSIKVTVAVFLTIAFIVAFCYIKLLIKALSVLKLRIVYKIYDH